MPDPIAPGPLPPDVAVQVRAYLAAFLPPAAIDEAVAEVTADSRFWGDTDAVEVLGVAHTVLTSRLRVASDVEALVLQEDVGLTVPEIAAVLGMPQPQVRRLLDEALAVLADPELDHASPGGTAPAPPDDTTATASPDDATAQEPPPPAAPPADDDVPAPVPTLPRRRRRTLVVAVVLAVVAVAVAAAWLVGG